MAMRQIKRDDPYSKLTEEFLSAHGDTDQNRSTDRRWRQLGKLAKAGRL